MCAPAILTNQINKMRRTRSRWLRRKKREDKEDLKKKPTQPSSRAECEGEKVIRDLMTRHGHERQAELYYEVMLENRKHEHVRRHEDTRRHDHIK